MDELPTIPGDLLDALEERFPEKTPDLTMTLDQIRHAGGERSVIRFLRHHYDRQNEAVINQQVLDVS